MYQRFSYWLRDLCEALSSLGEQPIDEHLARSLYEMGDSPELSAQYVRDLRQAEDRRREEEALMIARTLARAGLKRSTTGYSDEH